LKGISGGRFPFGTASPLSTKGKQWHETWRVPESCKVI